MSIFSVQRGGVMGPMAETPWVNVKDFGAVGDGVVDSYQSIQDAYDSLPSTGGCLVIPRGEFLIGSQWQISKPNISIIGFGSSSILKIKDGAELTDPIQFNYTAVGGKVQNLKIDGNKENDGSWGDGVSHNGSCVTVFASNFTMTDCEITKAGTWGVLCAPPNYSDPTPNGFVFTNNYFHHNGMYMGNGIRIYCSYDETNFYPYDFIVIGNRFAYNYGPLSTGDPLGQAFWGQASRVIFSNNYCYNNLNSGGQVCDSVGSDSWLISQNFLLCDTSLNERPTSGIELNGTKQRIVDNVIIGINGAGIAVQTGSNGGTNNVDSCVISENIFSGYPDAISLINTPAGKFSNSVISNNTFSDVDTGINNYGNKAQNVVVQGNTFSASVTTPILDAYGGIKAINNVGIWHKNQVVGVLNTPASTGDVSITGIGFKPSRIDIQTVPGGDTTNSKTSDSVTTIGATGTITSVCNFSSSNGTVACSSQNNKAINVLSASVSDEVIATVKSVDADGFTLNFTTTTYRMYARYVCYP